MSSSTVTVLITVRNGAEYLELALASVLRQTLRDTQVVVVDDASQDRTAEILASVGDPRVEVIRSDVPLGISQAKALGINRAVGRYVAMMDADDVAHPARLAVQRDYLDRRPDTALVGSNVTVIREDGHPLGVRMLPEGHLAVLWRLLVGSPFIHPAVMIRRDCLKAFPYRQEYECAQDYDLWARLLRVERGANIRWPLLLYRSHSGQLSRAYRGAQLVEHDLIAKHVIKEQLPSLDLPPAALGPMLRFMNGVPVDDPAVEEIGATFLQMARVFLAVHEGCVGREEVLQDVAVAVARRFSPQLRNGATRAIFGELIRMDPLAPARCARSFASFADLRFRSRRAARLLVQDLSL